MDFDKLINFSTSYLSEYLWAFIETLRKPSIRFHPQPIAQHLQQPVLVGATTVTQTQALNLNPKLLSFVFISFFIGFTINSLIPNKSTSPDLATTGIVVFAFWLLHSTVTHWFCKVSGSKATYLQTLSISLQLFAVLYVLSNFITLLLGTVVTFPAIGVFTTEIGLESFVKDPILFFFPVQFVLLLVYLPLAIRNSQGLNFRLFAMIWGQVVIIVFCGVLSYFALGIQYMLITP